MLGTSSFRRSPFGNLFANPPGGAAINEAVELAKRYGSANSAPFVNGILDKFRKREES